MFQLDEAYKNNLNELIQGWKDKHETQLPIADAVRSLLTDLNATKMLAAGWDHPQGDGDFRKQFYLHHALARQLPGSMGLCVASHLDIAGQLLAKTADNETVESTLQRALKGQAILALAMTEPDAGSDLQGVNFSAEKQGDDWVLNGAKYGITNLPFADAVIVLARTRKERTPFSYSLFMLPTDTDGVTVNDALDTLGYPGCLGSMQVENAVLSDAHLLGQPGLGLTLLIQHLDKERLIVGARMSGVAEFILSEMIRECQSRITFGTSLINHQYVSFRIAELQARLLAFQALLEQCIDAFLQGNLPSTRTAVLKYTGATLVNDLSDLYMQFSGGRGYMQGHAAEQLYREMPGLALAGGSKEIMLNIIANDIC